MTSNTASRALSSAPSHLRCQLLEHPECTGLAPRPLFFSWRVHDVRRGARQAAYQILVASTHAHLLDGTGDLWDSGRVASAQSVAVPYAGQPLPATQSCFWQVRTWDAGHAGSPWSAIQEFRMADPAGQPGDIAASHRNEDFTDRIPLLTTDVAPIRIAAIGPQCWFVDFGKAAFGTILLTVDSPSAATLDLHLGEVLAKPDTVDREPGGTRRYQRIPLALRAGRHTYTVAIPPDARNTGPAAIRMPASAGEVMPFRYCEVHGYPGTLDGVSIRQRVVHYAFDDQAARFACSDPTLDAIWSLCQYSMKATSFCGVYVDGDRERIPYEADAYINQLSHYGVDSEYSLARHTIRHLLRYPTWPTEWQLHMPLMAWQDYLHTGHADLLATHYDTLKAKTLWRLARADGLISTPADPLPPDVAQSINIAKIRDVVDWPGGERDGYVLSPINTVVNAFHFKALSVMARIAAALGREPDAQDFLRRAERVRDAINTVLFNPASGLYLDGEGVDHSSQHANFFPLAMGIVPDNRQPAVVAFLIRKGMACSVYAAQYLLEALYAAGQPDQAMKLMTDRTTDRSWAHMIYNVGTTITLEAWDNRYKPNQDWNHAWGAAPGNIIPRCLMGIEPIEPGFARVRIRPQLGTLRHASIRLPTVRGPIEVAIRRETSSRHMALHVPANMVAEVHIPADSPDAVREGGHPAGRSPNVAFLRMEAGHAVFEVGAGCTVFEARSR